MTKYEIYRTMCDTAYKLEKAIREYYDKKGLKVYCAYVSVGNEEQRLYFVDIEIGGSANTYKRIYGLKSEDALINKYMKGEDDHDN